LTRTRFSRSFVDSGYASKAETNTGTRLTCRVPEKCRTAEA
jgi:hypothetical protein